MFLPTGPKICSDSSATVGDSATVDATVANCRTGRRKQNIGAIRRQLRCPVHAHQNVVCEPGITCSTEHRRSKLDRVRAKLILF